MTEVRTVPAFRYHVGHSRAVDPFMARMDRTDAVMFRWHYRTMRRVGLSRAMARSVIHSAFHVGWRTGYGDGLGA